MAPTADRRTFLRAAALLAATPAIRPGRAAAAVPTTWTAAPFALSDVSLGPGVFAAKRQFVLDHARGYDVDRLVQVFRANANLPTLGAVAPGGWEGLDGEANGNLRGHYTGHFLSMLAQAYASTGEAVFRDRIGYLVGALTEVRAALRRAPAVRSVPGRFGPAVEFARGSHHYVELPGPGTATALTISAWVRPTHATTWARILDLGNDTRRYLYLAARSDRGGPRFAITTTGASGEQGIDGTAALPLDRWSHVAVTLSGSVGTLYVDGAVAGTNPAVTLTPAQLGDLRNNWLGRSQYPDPVFAGGFGHVDLYSRALTAAQIGQLQAAPPASTPVGRGDLASYDLDETGGGTIADRSGRGSTGTVRRTWGAPSHPGFLAAYPETQFSTLETMTIGDYTVVWAPYYTAHKILRGLLDAHTATGDARALDLASGLCDWMHSRLSRLPDATLQRMWGINSSGEYGGIVEAICDTHALTGQAEHLALARLFDLDRLIDNTAANRDILTGLHANQHIPIFTGLLRLYDATGEARYLDAARNFWTMVVPPRMYSIGGTSIREFFREPGRVGGTIHPENAETCCAYNLLRLSRMLFCHRPDPAYMDFAERALYNQVLGSKQDRADAQTPRVTYFIGLTPGHVRDYTPKQGTTCCEGTGLESATKYQDSVYFRSADGSALYVNLYIPSTLTWPGRGVSVEQRTGFPVEQGSTLTVRGSAGFTLRLRVPEWARAGFEVRVNGAVVPGTPVPGTYLDVARAWRDGDTVRVSMPFRLQAEPTPDDRALQSLRYGPIVLAARSAQTSHLQFGLYRNAALSGDLRPTLTPVAGRPLHFTLDGVEFAPFYEGTEDPTHVYVRRSEPRVVFGTRDAGVANPARPDGTTLLDDVWANAPFADRSALVDHVQVTVDAWTAAGLLSAGDATKVVDTARAATFAA